MKRQVILVAKAPVPGRSKTRLVPPLSAEQAAELQRALLLDTLAACRAEVPDTAILHSDPDEAAALRSLAGGETRLILQEGRGLGAALAGAMARLLPDGPVALVSSDIPGIPDGALGRAFAALDGGADVVLGPALDGGYWLIAMREYHDEPFRRILWSTPAVYATTVRRCAEAGLRVHALEPWRDLDTPVDLDFALAELDGLQAPRTEQMLRELRSAGIAIGEPPRVGLAASELAPVVSLARGAERRADAPGRLADASTHISPSRAPCSSCPSPTAATSCSFASTATRCATGRSRCRRARLTTASPRSRRRPASSPRRRAGGHATGATSRPSTPRART